MTDEKIKVRIKPLHGIGGIGEAGDVVMMSREDAEMYFREGYVEYIEVSSQQSVPQAGSSTVSGQAEDHVIMKPKKRRK